MASTKIREQITFLSNNHLKLTKQTKQQAQQQDINKQFISTHSHWRRCRNLRCSKISCKSRSPLTDPEPHTFPDVCKTNNRCKFSFRKIVGPRTSRGSSARFWWCLSCKKLFCMNFLRSRSQLVRSHKDIAVRKYRMNFCSFSRNEKFGNKTFSSAKCAKSLSLMIKYIKSL